jgi:hypothetical protein
MSQTPQLILRLSPTGNVVAELPGANGSRRVIAIESLEQVRRILTARLCGEDRRIGYDTAPTQAQVDEWLRRHPKKRSRSTKVDLLRKAGLLS